jgi:hypothetical protein
MSADEHEAILQRMAASLEDAMAAAQQVLEADEVSEVVELAELALFGIQVVRWRVPGPSRPVCLQCGRVDQWYQQVDSGCVCCLCQLAA